MKVLSGRLTYRQTALVLLAVAYLGQGFTVHHNPGFGIHDQAIVYEWWPLWVRTTIWVGAAAVMTLTALSRNVMRQVIGWQAASVPLLIRLGSHLWSFAMWIIPGAPGGSPLAVAYVLWWAGIWGLVLLMSRWSEDGMNTDGGV